MSTQTAAQQHLEPDSKLALRGARNIREDLLSGVTTMRTLSDRNFIDVMVREAVNEGEIPGPRLVVSTRALRSTHGWGSSAVVVDGVEQVRRAVRENLLWGADVIKLMITSWAGRDPARFQEGAFRLEPTLSREEIAAAIDEAHRLGKPVAAHVHGGPGLRWALESGLDTVEHGGDVTDEDIELILKKDAWLVFTLTVLFHSSGLPAIATYQVSPFREQLEARQERVRRLVSKVAKAGVKYTIGTDGRHGSFHLEMCYLVQFGLSPMEAIVAGTSRAAKALRLDDQLGSLEVNKQADIISVRGDPLTDINVMENVHLIMKGGHRFDTLSAI